MYLRNIYTHPSKFLHKYVHFYMHIYALSTNIDAHMYVTTINEKRPLNWKRLREAHESVWRNERANDAIINSKNLKIFIKK